MEFANANAETHSSLQLDNDAHTQSMETGTCDAGAESLSSPLQHDNTSAVASHKQCCEGRVANVIIQVTQAMMWTPLAILWIILVIISGAIFFFFMVGAVPLGHEEKEEKWLNYSIQVLNVLFTYAAVANEPKRLRDFIRLRRMKGTVGLDWLGNTSTEIFDYVPYYHRMFVVVNLNLNCIFQYINQAFRIVYFTPELAADHVLEVNLFFALSFLCAFVAPIHQYRMEQGVRKEGRAPPGQELDPIQKFVGRADWSYRELGIKGYQFAMNLLKKRMASDDAEKTNTEKDDAQTDRTAVADSQMSLACSQAEPGTRERQDGELDIKSPDPLFSPDDSSV